MSEQEIKDAIIFLISELGYEVDNDNQVIIYTGYKFDDYGKLIPLRDEVIYDDREKHSTDGYS